MSPADKSLGSAGIIQLSSCLWNTVPALYPHTDTGSYVFVDLMKVYDLSQYPLGDALGTLGIRPFIIEHLVPVQPE